MSKSSPLAALTLTALLAPAHAEQAPAIKFDIPAQPLNQALLAFGKQSGKQIVYRTELTDQLRSQPLKGSYNAADAVRVILNGAPLQVASNRDGTMTLERRIAAATPQADKQIRPAQESIATLPTVKVTAPELAYQDDPHDPQGYHVTHASTALRTDTPLMETPLSVQVVPQQLLKDQQDIHLDKALNYVSGVYTADATGQGSFYIIRGFASSEQLRDGYKDARNNSIEMGNIEQVEILKGPASILNGRIEPGGVVNRVTKKPQQTPYYALQQQFGSYDLYRTSLDATAPLTQNKDLSYRLNLSYETAGSFRQFVDRESVFVAPVLRWDISDKTQANFELEYLHAAEPIDTSVVFVNGQALGRNRNLSGPTSSQTTDKIRVGTYWSHAFDEQWVLRGRFDYIDKDENIPQQAIFQGFGPPDYSYTTCDGAGAACYGSLMAFSSPKHESTYNAALNLTGHFDTWGLKHTLYVGADYNRLANNNLFSANSGGKKWFNLAGPTPSFDSSAYIWDYSLRRKNTTETIGVAFQDQIKLPYDIHVLGGFRYDDYSQDTITQSVVPASPSKLGKSPEDKITPRFGLLWQPLPELSIYGNYVEGFGAGNINFNGNILPPETSQQKEVGIKTELFDKRLIASVAWYDIVKQNVATPDPNAAQANLGSLVTTGEVRNQGLEVDVAGEVLPGLKLIGAYSYIDSEITKDRGLDYNHLDADGNPTFTNGRQGKRFWGTPKHAGSLWTTYEFQSGELSGLKFGGGVVIRDRVGNLDFDNSTAPGYAKVNLMASYAWKIGKSKLTTQVNIDNLLDKDTISAGNRGFSFGLPRTVLGSLRLEF